jgi:hypothetical protein
LLPAGAVAGWDLHPLESAAFSRRTPLSDIVVEQPVSQSAAAFAAQSTLCPVMQM